MCDYSLEMYASRAARENEVYITSRFPSGSIGLTAPDDPGTAVCLACGSRLSLENLSLETQKAFGVKDAEAVKFIRLEEGLYRDGVAFDNGVRIALTRLGTGVLVSLMDQPRAAKARDEAEAPAEADRMIEMLPAE
jgi:hypothetical protein